VKLTKKEIIRGFQANVNEQINRAWAIEKKLKRKKVFDEEIRIDAGSTQGVVARKGNKLFVILAGSDGLEKENADWVGRKGNFNALGALLPVKMSPITKKIKTKAKVHAGNLAAWKEVKKNIIKAIDRFKNIGEIIFVSHSKGGSISEIGAENIGWLYLGKIFVKLVSECGNKTGNKAFLYLLLQHTVECIKISARKDPVPFVPPFWFAQLPNHIILERTDITGIKKFFWNFLPFATSSHYPDLVTKLAKEQL